MQVKYCTSDGLVIQLRARSHSLTNGKVRRTKRYTAGRSTGLAAYDPTTDRCYYLPAYELGEGMNVVALRLVPTRNAQEVGVRYARDYLDPEPPPQLSLKVEPAGLEPAPFRMQTERSSN